MAEIKAATNEKVFQIAAFRGLNQAPDGDTKLKLGEAAEMDNFRITRDGNLQRRPGLRTVVDLETQNPIKGLWVGHIGPYEYMLGACNGMLYQFWKEGDASLAPVAIGEIGTDKDVCIFGFSGKAYILDGSCYWEWDGTEYWEKTGDTPTRVEGYVPLVWTSISPVGASGDESASLENVNRLTNKRRVWLSPDGNGATFKLPEKFTNVIRVTDFVSGDVSPEHYSFDGDEKTISFDFTPGQAVDRFEVEYSVENDFRSQVEQMQYSELFSGVQDARVFLYGNGTNKTLYSGIDYNGNPRADYFPDLYEAAVGDENTPITSMIRHYSTLACFKTDSAWSISANSLSLSDGLNIPAFYVTPVNKSIGNEAPGQATLVLNSPYTLFNNDLYEWKNSSYYTSNLTRDERQARCISDRVWATLKTFSAKSCKCYDDNAAQEFYICYGGIALVYNYAVDAWSKYSAFSMSCMANIGDELYVGAPDGKIRRFDANALDDDGNAILSYWESGSMGFGQEYMRKYSAMTWLSIKPESKSKVSVSVRTDKKLCAEKTIETDAYVFDFAELDFETLQFDNNYYAQIYQEKIKAKKFVYYKLILQNSTTGTRCTILSADIRVRFTGMAK